MEEVKKDIYNNKYLVWKNEVNVFLNTFKVCNKLVLL